MTHAPDLFEVECPECDKKFKVEIDGLEADDNVVCECGTEFDGYEQYLEASDSWDEDDNDLDDDEEEE